MKKAVAVLMILLILIPVNLFSEPLAGYEPYEEGEFPLWTYRIRRAETIFFGSLVITFPLSILLHGVARSAGIIPPGSGEMNDLLAQAAIAGALSLGVSVADWVLGLER
ncbi:MAG: hypothetical protein GX911_07590 [Spirochaetales bacterium]|nr:hypothetical protein [Spirochaetales bacterium]